MRGSRSASCSPTVGCARGRLREPTIPRRRRARPRRVDKLPKLPPGWKPYVNHRAGFAIGRAPGVAAAAPRHDDAADLARPARRGLDIGRPHDRGDRVPARRLRRAGDRGTAVRAHRRRQAASLRGPLQRRGGGRDRALAKRPAPAADVHRAAQGSRRHLCGARGPQRRARHALLRAGGAADDQDAARAPGRLDPQRSGRSG